MSGSEGAPPYGLRHEEKSEESSECKERRDERMKRALFLHSLLVTVLATRPVFTLRTLPTQLPNPIPSG